MKKMMPLALLAALTLMAGCESRVETAATTDSTVAVADRAAEIAGDKTMMADAMRRSRERGTFDDAVALAIQDSAVAADMIAALKGDPRFAAMFGAPASTSTTPRGTTAQKATSRSTGGRAVVVRNGTSSGDALDKAERTVQKANEKIDQAARVKQQADDAARKVEGIFKPR